MNQAMKKLKFNKGVTKELECISNNNRQRFKGKKRKTETNKQTSKNVAGL